MKYIDKLDLQSEEVKEVENLEKHTVINNNPFSVDEYEGHDRDFLSIDGDYNDGFNQLNETVTFGVNCKVSREVNNLKASLEYIQINLNDKSLPPASQYYLGHFKMTKVDGSDSTLWICIELSDGTYSWKRISLS